MALVFKNLVQDATESEGLGPIVLTGVAAEGFRSFADAEFADGDRTVFAVKHGAYWEAALGTVGISGDVATLTRDQLIASSTGDPIDFAPGEKQVLNALPAELGTVHIGEDAPEGIETRLWVKPSTGALAIYADFGAGLDWQALGGGGGGSGGLLHARVEVSSAEILTLASSPVELIPAPGAGKMIRVVDGAAFYSFLTTPYVDGGSYPYIAIGNEVITPDGINIVSTEDSLTLSTPLAGTFYTPDLVDQPASLRAFVDYEPTGGIATASVYDGGSGYDVGDTGSVAAGNGDATYVVDAVDGGGAVTAFTIDVPGTGYAEGASPATSPNTGVGDGAFRITINSISDPSQGDGTLVIDLLYRIVDLP